MRHRWQLLPELQCPQLIRVSLKAPAACEVEAQDVVAERRERIHLEPTVAADEIGKRLGLALKVCVTWVLRASWRSGLSGVGGLKYSP